MKKWKMRFNNGIPCTWDGDKYDEEREVEPFEADLYIKGYGRGCSSAVVFLVNYADRRKEFNTCIPKIVFYQVFMSDLTDIVKKMVRGRIKGTFIFTKKGANYGLKLYK